MKITFPNMGSAIYAFKALLEPLGADVVFPPPVTKETIDLGVKYSPEFVCFPFKVNVGDFIRSIESGVTNLITATDFGPCRFGFYHAIQERILRDLGYDFRMIALPQGDLLEFKWIKTLDEVCEYTGLKKLSAAWKGVRLFLIKAKLIEDIENAEGKYRCREVNRGDTDRIKRELLEKLDATKRLKDLRNFRNVIHEEFQKMDMDMSFEPLKVFLTGEIHVTLEPYVNRDLKKKLGKLGCEVTQTLSLHDWIMHKFHVNFHRKEMAHLARPHMPLDIGGEAVWVLGEYIWAATHGYDGFFHLYPFTCMPEITARGIITNKLLKEYDLPPLFVSLDENLAEAGLITRLEAMVDLMHGKRKKKNEYKQKLNAFMDSEKQDYLANQQQHK
ncbi:CoA protein activase [Candidatus Bathyarchaeota archaeon]|nr:CoA protein activase [Candidatus Bathyarchaeota archaeon]